jgi:hypothetical protein
VSRHLSAPLVRLFAQLASLIRRWQPRINLAPGLEDLPELPGHLQKKQPLTVHLPTGIREHQRQKKVSPCAGIDHSSQDVHGYRKVE